MERRIAIRCSTFWKFAVDASPVLEYQEAMRNAPSNANEDRRSTGDVHSLVNMPNRESIRSAQEIPELIPAYAGDYPGRSPRLPGIIPDESPLLSGISGDLVV
jgi:hypothetical protein